MQAKIFAGTDCLRFLRVTGGNLPAPAGNSHEVFIVCVRADFFKARDVSFYPIPNTLTKVTICCLWTQWWTVQIWFCSKSIEFFLAGSSNRYPKKNSSMKKSSLPSKWSGTVCCHFFGFLTHTEWRKDNKQKLKLVLNSNWNTVQFR